MNKEQAKQYLDILRKQSDGLAINMEKCEKLNLNNMVIQYRQRLAANGVISYYLRKQIYDN